MQFIFLCLILVLTSLPFAQERFCATNKFFHDKNDRKFSHQASLEIAFSRSLTNCDAEDYYDKVLTRKTNHFQIFYTLEGPHATTESMVDSVEIVLEKAYKLHTQTLGMKTPLGDETSYHYRQKIEAGLYPVEILDLDLLRNGKNIFQSPTCGGCYGLTYPLDDGEQGISILFLENDYKYTNGIGERKTIEKDGRQCYYIESDIPLTNLKTNEDYSKNWDKALRVTVYHELYHSMQLRYISTSNYTFWFEASATGVEEIGAPDVNDYFNYIATANAIIGTPINKIGIDPNVNYKYAYGICSLYLYLYNNVQKNFDRQIWESYSKNPDKTMDVHLTKYLNQKKLNADSVFHDYAVRFSFSGNRSSAVSVKTLIYEEASEWNSVPFKTEDNFTPDTSKFTYSYNLNGHPDISNYVGRVSAIIYNKGKATIVPVNSTNTADSLASMENTRDSLVWVFSRLGESEYIKTNQSDSELKAAPTPWREGSLCFAPLPRDKKTLEIRNRRGAIVYQERYEGAMHCIDENTIKKSMVPGVYWFRAGNSGKAKKMMIIY